MCIRDRILHVIIVLIFNFTILRDIEKMAGWLRTTLIYMLSGIGGNLWSSILIPYEPEVSSHQNEFDLFVFLTISYFGYKFSQYPIN